MALTKKIKLRTTVLLFTVSSILFTLIVAGIAINAVLSDLHGERAQSELQHAYKLVSDKLGHIEKDIATYSLYISTNKLVIATTHLVNRYQNKKNYQPLVFDNDKKKVANELLQHILLTKSSQAAIYGVRGELIAYAIYNRDYKHAGITTYKRGRVRYLINEGINGKWKYSSLASGIPAKIQSLNKNKASNTFSGESIYRASNGGLIVENSRFITRSLPGGGMSPVGVVKILTLLDKGGFQQISSKINVDVSLLHEHVSQPEQLLSFKELEQGSKLFGSSQQSNAVMQHNANHFIQSWLLPTVEGKTYLLISQPKVELLTALNRTRASLVLIFFITALLSIFFGVYMLNKAIVKPIHALVDRAGVIKKDGYPEFPEDIVSPEISRLGGVLNEMVDTIRQRCLELTSNEKLLKNTQQLAKLGSWKFDHANGNLTWSDETYHIFGLDPVSFEPSYEAVMDKIHPEDRAYVETAYSESINNQTQHDIHHRLLMADGSIKYVREYCETEFDDNGNPVVSIGTVQDITEQTIKDEQLRRTQKMNALDQLTGGIAHDFNNTLSVILGFAELLQLEPGIEPQQADYIDEIFLAGERARKLTAKLLAFTRKDITSACSTEINQLLLDEQHMLQKTLTVRINLALELADGLWPVWLDTDELEDAILNMSINAMHAMPDGGKLVLATCNTRLDTVDVRNMDITPGEYVLLTLTDTGKGMNTETIQRIFEPFYSTKKEKGTGLGMSQVYGFVHRAKGEITVYSELNYGTRINIYLPRYQVKDTAVSEPQQIEQKEDLSGLATILVVDDEVALCQLSKEILSSRGYSVLSANTGKQALKLLETESVDLLLSDVIMPGMSGYELAAEVEKLYPRIKIQMASGFADESDIDPAVDELHKQRLQKPYSSTALLQKVKSLLENDENELDMKVG